MYRALIAKFTQHPDLLRLLVETGDRELVEHSPHDSYWGDGPDGKGKNRLGILLMKLRAAFKGKESQPDPGPLLHGRGGGESGVAKIPTRKKGGGEGEGGREGRLGWGKNDIEKDAVNENTQTSAVGGQTTTHRDTSACSSDKGTIQVTGKNKPLNPIPGQAQRCDSSTPVAPAQSTEDSRVQGKEQNRDSPAHTQAHSPPSADEHLLLPSVTTPADSSSPQPTSNIAGGQQSVTFPVDNKNGGDEVPMEVDSSPPLADEDMETA